MNTTTPRTANEAIEFSRALAAERTAMAYVAGGYLGAQYDERLVSAEIRSAVKAEGKRRLAIALAEARAAVRPTNRRRLTVWADPYCAAHGKQVSDLSDADLLRIRRARVNGMVLADDFYSDAELIAEIARRSLKEAV